jgi:DNA-binding SARP family transcriptional activator
MTPRRLRLQLLDSFTLHDGAAEVVVPQMGQRLVAFVALNRSVTRARAAGALWPDADEDVDSGVLRLRPGAVVDTDVLADNARVLAAVAPGEQLGEVPAVPLHGDLLPGWYEEWLVAPRERLRQLHLHALEGLVEQYLHRGWYGTALEVALTAAEVEPLRETAQQLIMRVHLAEGNVCEAVRTFEAFSALLWRDLGVMPSERTCAVIATAAIAPQRPAPSSLERAG